MVLNTLNIQYKKMNIVSNEEKFTDYLLNWLHVTVLIERKESNFGNKKIYLTLLSERLSCVSVIFTDDLA